MLKLAKVGIEPAWIEAMGARFLFAPITRVMYRRARRQMREQAATLGDDLSPEDRNELIGDKISELLITEGLIDWEGVGDDDDAPIACTGENKALLLADPVRFETLDQLYVMPFALRIAEGNGLLASPNGTGAEATQAKATASSRPARPKRTAAAKNARTGSTSLKRPKQRKSGTS